MFYAAVMHEKTTNTIYKMFKRKYHILNFEISQLISLNGETVRRIALSCV